LKTTRQRTKSVASFTAAALLLLAFCLWRPAEVRAQQWTTCTNGTNTTGGFIRSLANLPFFIGTTGAPQALTLTDSGFLGIGTTTPARLLEISASSTNTIVYNASTAALSIFNTNTTTANNTADLTFRTFDAGGTAISPAKVVAVFTNRSAGAASGDMAFVTLNAGTSAERMRVTGTGGGRGRANLHLQRVGVG
jgi:hypothetical protein